MDIFKRKRPNRNERIVLATRGEVVQLTSTPLNDAKINRPSDDVPNEADNARLADLSDLELLGAFVVSRRDGDRETMATIQRELENRGIAGELSDL